jgi:hypothetical protein
MAQNSLAVRSQSDKSVNPFANEGIATDANFGICFLLAVASTSADSDGLELASVKPTAIEKASR